jgi:hypothetical protein
MNLFGSIRSGLRGDNAIKRKILWQAAARLAYSFTVAHADADIIFVFLFI